MVSNHTAVFSDKKLHMYEFPKSVQEWMYNACEFGESHEIQRLFNLKNRKMYAQKNSYICFAMHVLHLEKRQKQKLC